MKWWAICQSSSPVCQALVFFPASLPAYDLWRLIQGQAALCAVVRPSRWCYRVYCSLATLVGLCVSLPVIRGRNYGGPIICARRFAARISLIICYHIIESRACPGGCIVAQVYASCHAVRYFSNEIKVANLVAEFTFQPINNADRVLWWTDIRITLFLASLVRTVGTIGLYAYTDLKIKFVLIKQTKLIILITFYLLLHVLGLNVNCDNLNTK